MTIRRLPNTTINRIAAGEVIERPASAIKELVENALDAGADTITVWVRDGGISSITVADNGCGMTADDLPLCLERHATSKLPDDDLFYISTMGFRGEALPSIASVSRMTITSRTAQCDTAWQITVNGGEHESVKPTAGDTGTKIVVRDLFYATPARLKFLRGERAEMNAITDVLKRLAMAHPAVSFALYDGEKQRLNYTVSTQGYLGDSGADNAQNTSQTLNRLQQVMGADFGTNALPIEKIRPAHDGIGTEGTDGIDRATDGDIRIAGYCGVPTYNRGVGDMQFLFVNGRPVRDKLVLGAVRGAYQDYLARDRHPVLAVFIQVPPAFVDVNVHPAKTEVRFKNPALVRGCLVSALKNALAQGGFQASTTVAGTALNRMTAHTAPPLPTPQMHLSQFNAQNPIPQSEQFAPHSFTPHMADGVQTNRPVARHGGYDSV